MRQKIIVLAGLFAAAMVAGEAQATYKNPGCKKNCGTPPPPTSTPTPPPPVNPPPGGGTTNNGGTGNGYGGNASANAGAAANAGVNNSGNSSSNSGVTGSGNSAVTGSGNSNNRNNNTANGGNAVAGGGAVTGSGNSANNIRNDNSSSNVANGGSAAGGSASSSATGGNATVGNTTSNSGGNTLSGGDQNTSVTVEGDNVHYEAQKRNPVSTAYAAGLTATNGSCYGSSSAGAQGVGFGLSFGTTWKDDDCDRRYDSQELRAQGLTLAATALMCQKDTVRKAMEEAGTPCPQDKNKKTAAVVVPQQQVTPVVSQVTPWGTPMNVSKTDEVAYTGTDPIIRARLGLPPLAATN